ncbi:MAG TPA: DNA-directed RNA polymerase subunit alpha, partial [Nitrospirae bacterium]|nr:DNA-directed RNA polymerase subunit alpha [Nitrospirota bacterium]
ESLTKAYGKFSIEAFERGFGTTLGNALRRILLSSIEGSAVTSVRIPGVLHELSTIPGVKEDFVDIILNVKQLRVKLHTDVSKVISINVKGPAEVKGNDINAGAQVEILTPDLHIVTLEKNVNFKMELTVTRGKGYAPAELNKTEDQAVDVIAVDSLFSPIRKVNSQVENARVGRSTDYDRLMMEIWTDGSISPKQALTQASDILTGHLSLFSLKEEPVIQEEVSIVETEDDDEEVPAVFNDNLLKSVDELELSVRSANCLKNANIRTIADLVQKSEQEMLRTKNFGRKSLNEIKEVLASMGLHCHMRIDTDMLETSVSSGKGEKDAS